MTTWTMIAALAVPSWLAGQWPLVGLITATLVAIVVLRKRWLKLPLLARCVLLSVYAHILLILLVFTTNIFNWSPPRHGPDMREVRVQFTGPDSSSASKTPVAVSSHEPSPDSIALEHIAAPPLLPASEAVNALPEVPPALEPPAPPTLASEAKLAPSPQESLPLQTIAEVIAEVAPRYSSSVARETKPPEEKLRPENTPAPANEQIAANSTPIKSATSHSRPVPALYRLRFQEHDAATLAEQGGSADTEAAVNEALAWLARNQEPSGRWSAARHEAGQKIPAADHDRGNTGADADTGITALALLAFLGAGHTHVKGEHRLVVQRGLEYLVSQQKANGSLAGEAKLFASMYCHGMATFAVAEALVLSGDERLRPYLARAIQYTVAAQHARGGWRYQPGDVGDMSQFGWQIMALKSAHMAGISPAPLVEQRAQTFLASVTSGQNHGLAAYRAGEPPSRTMTAEALLCRYLLQPRVDSIALAEAEEYLLAELPRADRTNIYYWYYGTLALRFSGGQAWQKWNEALKPALLSTQQTTGPQAGSWNPDQTWGAYGGRVFQTALGTLCLEAYYRYDVGGK